MSDKVYLTLSVSDRVRELESEGQGSRQFTINHSNVLQLLSLADLDEKTSVSRKNPLRLTCTTPKGTEFTLYQGDTHAIHRTHQSDETAQKVLDWAWDQDGPVQFDVLSVEQASGLPSAPQSDAPAVNMDDCPI